MDSHQTTAPGASYEVGIPPTTPQARLTPISYRFYYEATSIISSRFTFEATGRFCCSSERLRRRLAKAARSGLIGIENSVCRLSVRGVNCQGPRCLIEGNFYCKPSHPWLRSAVRCIRSTAPPDKIRPATIVVSESLNQGETPIARTCSGTVQRSSIKPVAEFRKKRETYPFPVWQTDPHLSPSLLFL
jgi:hypothetical protein